MWLLLLAIALVLDTTLSAVNVDVDVDVVSSIHYLIIRVAVGVDVVSPYTIPLSAIDVDVARSTDITSCLFMNKACTSIKTQSWKTMQFIAREDTVPRYLYSNT
jgi:hypothetical protein